MTEVYSFYINTVNGSVTIIVGRAFFPLGGVLPLSAYSLNTGFLINLTASDQIYGNINIGTTGGPKTIGVAAGSFFGVQLVN